MAAPNSTPGARFDEQAAHFDTRAGLPPGVAALVADAIVGIAQLRPGARVFEVGAGTGEIGRELLSRGSAYVALDESPEMLAVFRDKARARSLAPELLVGDAGQPWPLDDASVGLVFGSRSLHWLSPDHVVSEALRVASPAGCAFLVGRVERADDSPRTRLRKKMREFLQSAGFRGRNGGESTRRVVEQLRVAGARPIPMTVAATWTIRSTPRSVVEAWHSKRGLGGADVPPPTKSAVLAQALAWAVETFGDIDVPVESEECYTLEGAMLAGTESPTR